MVHVAANYEGYPKLPLKKLDSGMVVPDASVAEIHRRMRDVPGNEIEFGATADALGYDYFVRPEHHFTLLGASSPNPALTQAVVAQHTDDIRLLQMANILPWRDPVRVAEETALLDVVSDGRAEVGVGTGLDARQTETLGQYWGGSSRDSTRNQHTFQEKFELLVSAFTDDYVSYSGEFHQVPPSYTEWEHDQEFHYLADDASEHEPTDYMSADTGSTTLDAVSVFPQPQQSPHPQLWRATGSEASVEWAARRGVNACYFFQSFDDVAEKVDTYHAAAADAGWPDHRPEHDGEPFKRGWDADRRRGFVVQFTVFNTDVADDETVERWKLGYEYLLSADRSTGKPSAVSIDADAALDADAAPVFGDTDEIIDRLASFREECGYEDLCLFPNVEMPGLTHDETLTQLRSFADDVVPYFDAEDRDVA